MKTKKGAIAAITVLFLVIPFFGTMSSVAATKPHKVILQNLTVDSIDTTAKTITAISEGTSYTINTSRAKIRRASGEKVPLSRFLEFLSDDSITVWGKTTDGININASKVRNNSTRKIKGLFLTTIAELAPADVPFPSGVQGEFLSVKNEDQLQVVFTFGYTKFKFGKKKSTYAALQAGDVITIQGASRIMDSITLIYNTTQIKVRSHGTPPADFLPTSFKFNR